VTAGPVGETGTFRYDPDYLGVHRDDGLVIVDITMRLLHFAAAPPPQTRR
jgi:hypothetical protein